MDQKEFRRKHFQLRGRIFYPKILKPELDEKKGKLMYKGMFAWQEGDPTNKTMLAEINKWLTAGKQQFFPKIPVQNLGLPIKTWGKYTKKNGEPMPQFLEGHQWLNFANNEQFRPLVVDRFKNEIINPADVWSGRNALIDISFWEYANDNYGFSVNCNALVMLDGGDRVASAGGADLSTFDQFLGEIGDNNVETTLEESLV